MRVGIIGLGYVGLPLAVAFAEAGHDVVGLDVDAATVERLAQGRAASRMSRRAPRRDRRPPRRRRRDPRRSPTATPSLICVPTPLANQREPDLSYIIDAAAGARRPCCSEGQLVVLESTTYPGTTRERLRPILEESGLAAGQDFHLAFSPERIDPGRTDHTIRTTPKVVGGLTEACRSARRALYARDLRRGGRGLHARRRRS